MLKRKGVLAGRLIGGEGTDKKQTLFLGSHDWVINQKQYEFKESKYDDCRFQMKNVQQ